MEPGREAQTRHSAHWQQAQASRGATLPDSTSARHTQRHIGTRTDTHIRMEGSPHPWGDMHGPSEHRDSYKCHSYPNKLRHTTSHVCKHASEKPLQINTCHNPSHKDRCRAHTRPTIDNAAQTQNTRTHAGTRQHPNTHDSDTQTHSPFCISLGDVQGLMCLFTGSPGLGHEIFKAYLKKWVKWGFPGP